MNRKTKRFRRTFAVALTLCTSAFIGLVAATPAQAAPPFDQEIFHPDDLPSWAGNASEGDYLSDKFDGKDSLAHLTAVATNDADRYRFYVCPAATADPVPPTAGGPTALGCTLIGEDTTPKTPTINAFVADEAYDVTWDIPGALDGLSRDIVGLACNGAEGATEPGTNCSAQNEDSILLEDAPTATLQESSGEMVEFCTLSAGTCAGSSIGLSGSGPEYAPYLHGVTVPEDGYSVRAYVSDDHSSVSAMFDFGAGATTPPATEDFFSIWSGPIFTGVAYEVYEESYSDGDIDDDAEFAQSLIEELGGGAGPKCSGDFCRTDTHYGASTGRVQGQVHIHNDSATTAGDDGTSQCEDEARTKTGEVATGENDQVIGCIFDQFSYFADFDGDGDKEKHLDALMDEPGTFHITTGNATFSDLAGTACEGTARDLDGDGLSEYCSVPSMGGDDKAEATFQAVTGGAIGIEFCDDPDTGSPAAANFGCGDAGSLKDTLSKNATPTIDHNHLRLSSQVAGTPRCHLGAASVNAATGSTVALTGCAQDIFHNGAPDVPVIWRIGNTPDDPARFVGTPEQRTDSNGEADASFTAPASAAGKFSNLFFCGDLDANGLCDTAAASFQISWTEGPGGGGACNKIRGSNQNDNLKGTPQDDCIKGRRGDDKLRGKAGDDLLKGGPGFDICKGGPGADRFRGCEVQKG